MREGDDQQHSSESLLVRLNEPTGHSTRDVDLVEGEGTDTSPIWIDCGRARDLTVSSRNPGLKAMSPRDSRPTVSVVAAKKGKSIRRRVTRGDRLTNGSLSQVECQSSQASVMRWQSCGQAAGDLRLVEPKWRMVELQTNSACRVIGVDGFEKFVL